MGFEKEKCEDYNSLQDIYQIFFDPQGQENYIKGEDVPRLYRAGNIEEIAFHCQQDVERLRRVTEKVMPFIGEYEMNRAINSL